MFHRRRAAGQHHHRPFQGLSHCNLLSDAIVVIFSPRLRTQPTEWTLSIKTTQSLSYKYIIHCQLPIPLSLWIIGTGTTFRYFLCCTHTMFYITPCSYSADGSSFISSQMQSRILLFDLISPFLSVWTAKVLHLAKWVLWDWVYQNKSYIIGVRLIRKPDKGLCRMYIFSVISAILINGMIKV